LGPIGLEDGPHRVDHLGIDNNHADFAALLELEPAEALAADERARAIAHDRADVEPPARKLLGLDTPLGFHPSDHLDVHTRLLPIDEDAENGVVAHFWIVDEKLAARALDELREAFATVLRAHDETTGARHVRLTVEIGLEQLARFLYQLPIFRHDSEAAALAHVAAREVEAVYMENGVVDDHHLAVIPQQIVSRARHGHPTLEQLQLELAEVFLPAAIGVRRQRPDVDAAAHRGFQGARQFRAVEPENEDIDRFFCLLDCREDGGDARIGLNDELHRYFPCAEVEPDITGELQQVPGQG
jgi:hypothetical protein